MTEAQAALMEQLVQVLAADPRIRAAWLSGSLARGGGDAWSDVDLTVEVDEADRRACLSDYVSGRPGVPPMVLVREIHGRILTAVTPDWARFDIVFLTGGELARLDGTGLKPLLGDAAAPPPPRVDGFDPAAEGRLAPLIEEFLRVLGLLPVAIGREEWLTAQQGWELLRRMLVDLMLEENRIPPGARGVKRLNPFLSPDQREALEGLDPPPARREALIAANLELARFFLARARPLAQARGVPWPEAFDQATRRHLRQTLGLQI